MPGRRAQEIMQNTMGADVATRAAVAIHSMATPESIPGHIETEGGFPCDPCLRAGELAADMAGSILGAEGIDLS